MKTKIVTQRPKAETKKSAPVLNSYVVEYADSYLVFTGILNVSTNTKTGAMIQTFILDKARLTSEPRVFGAKCEACPLVDVCYVSREKLSVRSAVKRLIEGETTTYAFAELDEVLPLLNGRAVRFGSYGDPSAIPLSDVERIASASQEWTGYTHFWRTIPSAYSAYFMASVESVEGELEAWSAGYRPFRVILEGAEPVVTEEMIECPHYTRGVQCVTCGLCKGNASKAKGIYVFQH
jgi:hypothetical protein